MRAMLTMTAGALICVGLASCNQAPQAPTPAPVVAAAPPVAAPPPQQIAAAPAPVAHRHRHRHAWQSHDDASYESYSESGETSSSRVSYDEDESESEGEGEGDGAAASAAPSGEAAIWVDGYGRSHTVASGSADANPAALTAQEERKRLAPWHAYDSKCAEKND